MSMRNLLLAILVISVHFVAIAAISMQKSIIRPPQVMTVSLVGSLVSPEKTGERPQEPAPAMSPSVSPEIPKKPVSRRVRKNPVLKKSLIKPVEKKEPVILSETQEHTDSISEIDSPAMTTDASAVASFDAHGKGHPDSLEGKNSFPETPITHPSTKAAYLKNAKPVYPLISRRLEEQGVVLLYVLVTAEGRAGKVEVKRSSGFPRLDESALITVRNWRFVAATRGGIPIEMWYELPIRFSLIN